MHDSHRQDRTGDYIWWPLTPLDSTECSTKYRTDIAKLLRRYSAPVGECVEWHGYRNQHGYGRACITTAERKVRLLAVHRLAYELCVGPLPDDAVLMHSCDNRACIRPAHLSIGTRALNNADAVAKGRAYWQRLAKRRAEEWERFAAQHGLQPVVASTEVVALPLVRSSPTPRVASPDRLQLPGHVWKRPLTP